MNTPEAILAVKDVVPKDVLVTSKAWKIFVEREARTEKLNQKAKAKVNRSKRTYAHYLGRTSYAETEENWPKHKPKPGRVDLYVEAHTNPKTNAVHPGAIADLEEINRIKSSQGESANGSLDKDALTQHFGKDKRGRTRGVGSTVSRTRLKNIEPYRNELQRVKAQVELNHDIMGGMRVDLNKLLKYVEEEKGFRKPNESRGSHDHIASSDKSIADQRSPHTPSSKTTKFFHLKSIDGRKTIAIVMIEKVSDGAIVHGHPMLPYELKVNVIKVLPGMHNEGLWLQNQGGEDTIGGAEGGYLVWPKHLVEDIVGDVNI